MVLIMILDGPTEGGSMNPSRDESAREPSNTPASPHGQEAVDYVVGFVRPEMQANPQAAEDAQTRGYLATAARMIMLAKNRAQSLLSTSSEPRPSLDINGTVKPT